MTFRFPARILLHCCAALALSACSETPPPDEIGDDVNALRASVGALRLNSGRWRDLEVLEMVMAELSCS